MTPYENIMQKLEMLRLYDQQIVGQIMSCDTRIQKNKQIITETQTYIVILIGIAAAILLLSIWRAVKQRKIEKMLKQLLEEKDRSE